MLIPKQKSNKDKNLVDCMICFKYKDKIVLFCKLDLMYFIKQSLNLMIHLGNSEINPMDRKVFVFSLQWCFTCMQNILFNEENTKTKTIFPSRLQKIHLYFSKGNQTINLSMFMP